MQPSGPTTYTSIRAVVEAEVEVKRSRFRCRLEPVADEAAARAVVDAARAAHWDARHHCSAFVLGPDGGTCRSSDDGEPAGTAGTPMLEVLRGRELTDVVAVVTRWFGGTLLGAGGLVRAYGDAVREAVAVAQPQVWDQVVHASVTVPHAQAGRVEHELRTRGLLVEGTRYAAEATVLVGVPPAQLEQAEGWVAAATGGGAALELGEVGWLARE